VTDETSDATAGGEPLEPSGAETDAFDVEAELHEIDARISEIPASVVVTNHAMGLYQLAAIHLQADPPHLADAALAIDALASLVEGLGDRLGEDAPTMRDALANIRLAFVQITNRT
jgi:hypothetical protein